MNILFEIWNKSQKKNENSTSKKTKNKKKWKSWLVFVLYFLFISFFYTYFVVVLMTVGFACQWDVELDQVQEACGTCKD